MPGTAITINGYQYTLGPQNPKDTSFFYTAGHGLSTGDRVTVNIAAPKIIGEITGVQLGGSSDSSQIQLSSGVEQAEMLKYSMAVPSVGTKVKMVGAVSGASSGSISRIDATVAYEEEEVTLTNMAQASYVCAKGDSGAPIFNNYSGTISDVTTCYGVHSGGLFLKGNDLVWNGASFFTKYENLIWTSPIVP